MRASTLLPAGLLLASLISGTGAAWGQTITVDKPSCMPAEDNGLVHATATGVAPGLIPRLYFRWMEHEDFYWIALEAEPGGHFWATPPKPERRNDHIEYYSALVDPTGKVVARSPMTTVPVTADCKAQLDSKQRGVAENLTVGETSPKQQGKKVLAFLCDGVVTRVNYAGLRRADEVCRACVVAWWQRKAVILPTIAATGVTTIISNRPDPEPSPSRP
ncbi:MAG TPA: hypothetical protein VGP73_21245 [Thermoanaerobaculia bacterium]